MRKGFDARRRGKKVKPSLRDAAWYLPPCNARCAAGRRADRSRTKGFESLLEMYFDHLISCRSIYHFALPTFEMLAKNPHRVLLAAAVILTTAWAPSVSAQTFNIGFCSSQPND